MSNKGETVQVNGLDSSKGSQNVAQGTKSASTELVVLDPNHRLMKRFQETLKQHLLKQHEKTELELRELADENKRSEKDKKYLGGIFMKLQQDLKKQQQSLEKYHSQYTKSAAGKKKGEENVKKIRSEYQEVIEKVRATRQSLFSTLKEIQTLSEQIRSVEKSKEDVKLDINTMQRATTKATKEIRKAEELKQKQDILVDRLTSNIQQIKDNLELYEAQCGAERQDLQATRTLVRDAIGEIETINMEKKQLYQQWNSTLVIMKRRDETLTALAQATEEEYQDTKSLLTEVEGVKVDIAKSQEEYEKENRLVRKLEGDINYQQRSLAQMKSETEELMVKYQEYSNILQHTEASLRLANTKNLGRRGELSTLVKEHDKIMEAQVKLEDEILAILQNKLTVDNAKSGSKKQLTKLRKTARELESLKSKTENEVTQVMMEVTDEMSQITSLENTVKEYREEIRKLNKTITGNEAEIQKTNIQVERKQHQVEQINKKIEQLLAATGGVELGPLEIQVSNLRKEIKKKQQEVKDAQHQWLRKQNELVKLSKQHELLQSEIETMDKKHTVLFQKMLRVESDIREREKAVTDTERRSRQLRNELEKMNMLLFKEKGLQSSLHRENLAMQQEFHATLKQAEKQAVHMEFKLQQTEDEKQELFNKLLETEQQLMLWEKKISLAKEAKETVNSEEGQGEIKQMKHEIHRMELKLNALKREQEDLIQQMEKTVRAREELFTREDVILKSKRVSSSNAVMRREVTEKKKRYKQVLRDIDECEGSQMQMNDKMEEMAAALEKKRLERVHLEKATRESDGQIRTHLTTRQQVFSDVVREQQRLKYLQAVVNKKYTLLLRSSPSISREHEKLEKRASCVCDIIDEVVGKCDGGERGELVMELTKVKAMLGSALTPVYLSPGPMLSRGSSRGSSARSSAASSRAPSVNTLTL